MINLQNCKIRKPRTEILLAFSIFVTVDQLIHPVIEITGITGVYLIFQFTKMEHASDLFLQRLRESLPPEFQLLKKSRNYAIKFVPPAGYLREKI